jgi:hypothetical protein
MKRGRGNCVTYGEELRCIQGNLKVRGHLEDPSAAGIIILKQILEMSVGKAWSGLIYLRTGISGGCF